MNNATDHPVSGLCVDALHFGYQLARPVVQGFSASLHAGRLTALIGPNAAGKTTLLKLMLGQLRPVSGTCTIDGRDVFRMPASRRAGRISYVPQHSAAAFAFSVEQIVAMGRFAVGHSPAAVARALEQCNLLHLRHRPFWALSAGQQQRVMIARAMAQSDRCEDRCLHCGHPLKGVVFWRCPKCDRPCGRVMLLDEPTSGLDLHHAHEMMKHLVALARGDLAVLAVLHDLNLAAYAQTLWLMHEGTLVASGPSQQVLRPEVLEPVYGVKLKSVQVDGDGREMLWVE